MLPLAGLLVADLSRVLAGPSATVMLADLGARVIKVERPGTGDDTRAWGPPWAGSTSSYFESANRSKESIALDFDDVDDLALARTLTDRADIVVENYRAGGLERFGLDYVSVAERNPRAVYASITGFGPESSEPGYDFLVQAMGGLMSITGAADGEPTKVGVAVIDLLTGKDAVMGILAALLHRERTGLGQHVEVDLLSSGLASLANQASSYLATGVAPGRRGNEHPSIAPYETLRCRDGMLAVAIGNDRQWRAFAELVDPALTGEERFATNALRVQNRADLVEALERALVVADVDAWIARLAGLPVGRVNDIGQALALAEGLGLQSVVPVGAGHPGQIRHPVRYSGFTPTSPVAPPALDEHGAEVRAWLSNLYTA